jgi:hypothetical protein
VTCDSKFDSMLLFPAPEPSASLSSLVMPLELAEANDALAVALRKMNSN